MRTTRTLAALLLAIGTGLAILRAQAPLPEIKRTEVVRHDLAEPGHEAIQVRVDFPPGSSFPKHTHPGIEIAYVLEGTMEYQLGDQAPVTLKAGQALFIPTGAAHSAKNVGSGNASELATYIVEKGKPLVTIVK
jgi:quercetin dioxygenase-like cupin family protein